MTAELVQHVVNGLILGGGYALMGIGLTLIFGIMRVVNFAHGELFMLGAFFLYTLFSLWGVNFFAANRLRSPCSRRWRCPSSFRMRRSSSGIRRPRRSGTRFRQCRSPSGPKVS